MKPLMLGTLSRVPAARLLQLGKRYIPASECNRAADGITWTCDVDGFTVTPWSGRGSSSQWANGSELVGRTAAAASGATEGTGPARTVNPPPI